MTESLIERLNNTNISKNNDINNINNIEETNVKDVYEKIATHFSNTRVYSWSWITEFLENIHSKNENSLIYDLGCGNGRNMNFKNLKFIGIDNCENFINICKSKNLNVIKSEITNTQLPSNSADAIICIAVIHHLVSEENRLRALLEIKRVIKSGGKILLSVWSINQPKKTRRNFKSYGNNIVLWNNYGESYERYYYIFKIDELKSLIKKAGLYILNHNYDCGNEIFVLLKL
jgi:alkylated DNA repair protein alkB family protein 8